MTFSKFREHRGGLAESMATTVDISTYIALLEYAHKLLDPWDVKFDRLEITHYGYDERIEWDCYLVSVPGYGVLGYTNGPVDALPK